MDVFQQIIHRPWVFDHDMQGLRRALLPPWAYCTCELFWPLHSSFRLNPGPDWALGFAPHGIGGSPHSSMQTLWSSPLPVPPTGPPWSPTPRSLTISSSSPTPWEYFQVHNYLMPCSRPRWCAPTERKVMEFIDLLPDMLEKASG